MLRFGLVFLTLTLAISINLDAGFLARLGVDPGILLVALIAFITAGLIAHRHIALIVIILVMTKGDNVPVETAVDIGYDPDYLLAGLAALIFTPILGEHLGFNFFMS